MLGPLVVAGVAGDPQALHDLGCRDSKLLAPGRRERISRLILADERFHVEVRVIASDTLDAEMGHRNLNQIEVVRFREVAASLIARGCTRIVLDAADVNAKRFGAHVGGGMPGHVLFVSEHKADRNHPTVAAASIVAKVERDRLVAQLARRLERRLEMEMGSGYPSDPKTKAFLAAWYDKYRDLPEGTRHSWAPARALVTPRQAALWGLAAPSG